MWTGLTKALVVAGLLCLPGYQVLACSGDIKGYWEKRPDGSKGNFATIEEFRIDSETGMLSICGSDREFQSELQLDTDVIKFGYRQRLRVLALSSTGDFVSQTWTAEHEGIRSQYRLRAER